MQGIKLLETGAVSIWGENKKKELRAETTVVQTNWVIVTPFPYTCPGAD